jgi:cyclopropane fatty-acyl-phospholipid synthase-like methyltransferase
MTDYIALYKEMHQEEERYPGESLEQHAPAIKALINKFDAKTLLDYGCGKGFQYTKKHIHKKFFNNILPSLYDPAVPTHDIIPEGTFDGVISTDVMEHIPEDRLDEILKEIYNKSDKFVYLGICTIPAIAILPNGENAHCTVKPINWWVEKITPHANKYTVVNCYGNKRITEIIKG